VTRRREVPTLAFTIPEAALAIRLSENTLRVWVREGIVGVVRWQSTDFIPRIELDRLIESAMSNGGTLPLTSAVSNAAPVSAVRAAALESGAAGPGPHATRSVVGEVGAVTAARADQPSGSPAPTRRSTPTTQEARRPRRASATTAG